MRDKVVQWVFQARPTRDRLPSSATGEVKMWIPFQKLRLRFRYKRGLARASQGDVDGAISEFTRAIALDPTCASSFTNRGAARAMTGDLDGAIADFDQAN